MGLDAQSLGLNSKSKNRPNTSKNNKTNFNLINNKRESQEGEDIIPINNFKEDINPNNIENQNSDLTENVTEQEICVTHEDESQNQTENQQKPMLVSRNFKNKPKFSSTAYGKFLNEEESNNDTLFNNTLYLSTMNSTENNSMNISLKNKARKSQSQTYEKIKELKSSLNKDFLDLFATK